MLSKLSLPIGNKTPLTGGGAWPAETIGGEHIFRDYVKNISMPLTDYVK